MQERLLKATIIALTVLLSLLVALGSCLVAGTQQGNTAPIIKSAFNLPDSESPSSTSLPFEDKKSTES